MGYTIFRHTHILIYIICISSIFSDNFSDMPHDQAPGPKKRINPTPKSRQNRPFFHVKDQSDQATFIFALVKLHGVNILIMGSGSGHQSKNMNPCINQYMVFPI